MPRSVRPGRGQRWRHLDLGQSCAPHRRTTTSTSHQAASADTGHHAESRRASKHGPARPHPQTHGTTPISYHARRCVSARGIVCGRLALDSKRKSSGGCEFADAHPLAYAGARSPRARARLCCRSRRRAPSALGARSFRSTRKKIARPSTSHRLSGRHNVGSSVSC